MKTTFYPSGINIPLAIIVFGPLVGFSIYAIIDKEWWAFFILFICLAFSAYLYASTFYAITENAVLVVRSGPFYNDRVPVNQIKKVEHTRTILSSPALSMKRLLILYDQGSVVISPRKQKEFLDHLKKLNPEIEIK